MGKVEEVAEAMWQAEWARAGNSGKRRVPWSEIAEVDQDRYRFVARAAIEAMREPDDGMIEAMQTENNLAPSGTGTYLFLSRAEVIASHYAMIDAALGEGE